MSILIISYLSLNNCFHNSAKGWDGGDPDGAVRIKKKIDEILAEKLMMMIIKVHIKVSTRQIYCISL